LHIFSFNQEALISFYALVSSFSGLCKLAWNVVSVFSNTYMCEQAFSLVK
jgi:hypothetical protein